MVVPGADQPAWSSDGKELAYVSRDSLFARGVEGGMPRLLATGLELHSPAWSPDGHFIAYVSTNTGFWLGGPLLGNLAPSILRVVPAAGGQPVKLSDRKFLNMSPV